ncbi:MAG: RHS repeat protein, partial [Planctomycetes bacterium]|nr:RHS repeat protein [Planctomycetota bacterium]
MGQETHWTFDALNRPITRREPDPQTVGGPGGALWTYQYDAVGNTTYVTNPLGKVTHNVFDGLDRLTSTTDPEGGVTQFRYDLLGNMTALTDPEGNETTFVFDGLSRVTSETNELGKSRFYRYDSIGNVIGLTDRNGREREFDYSNLDLTVEERWLDGQPQAIHTIEFDYDLLGRMVEGSDSFANYAFAVDPLGRVTEIDNLGSSGMPRVVLEQQFDAVGNRTGLSAAINGTADFADSFAFDFLSRMTSIRQTGQTGGNPVADKRVDLDYNLLGQFTSIERFADLGGTQLVVDSDFLYDHAARLTDLTHRQGSTVLADYDWTYDALSRVTNVWSPTDGSVAYSYDDTDQLTGANYSQLPDESFSYDLTGNRTMTGYVTGANNRLLSDGTYNYSHDDEGNRISKTNIATGEVTEYSWDHRNRLVGIVEKSGQGQVTQSVGYSYDCFDRRIAKVITPVVGPS